MKSDFHFHFYSRIIIMAILAVSLFFIQQSVRSKAQITSYPYQIGGWAWNAQLDDAVPPVPRGAGWISLNCYNDFEKAGEYYSTCYDAIDNPTGIDYSLQVDSVGNISGCMWAGSNLSGDTSPLGWICFDDVAASPRFGDQVTDLGVATTTAYLNALDPSKYASILSQEDWRCTNWPYLNCRQDADCGGGQCYFSNTDEAWKLGFPISDPITPSDTISSSKPIDGCFNCYEEKIYRCQSSPGSLWNGNWIGGTSCDPYNNLCGFVGDPPVQDPCIEVYHQNRCDNCLDYQYYQGRCELPAVLPDAADPFCESNDDCIAPKVCQEISTCQVYIPGVQHTDYDCTVFAGSTCASLNPVTYPCEPREIGSFKKIIGGYDCSACDIKDEDNICGVNAAGLNINTCEACANAFYTPGVMLDNKHYSLDPTRLLDPPEALSGEKAYLCGWAWNGYDDGFGNTNGLGWFQFGPKVVTSTKPYIFVDSGNIYSQKGVAGNYLPPFSHFNASYLIESGGRITNFVSSSTIAGLYQGERDHLKGLSFPKLTSGQYVNSLGSIDYVGLITDYSSGLNKNKYGASIITNSLNSGNTDGTTILTSIFSQPLGNDVNHIFPSPGIKSFILPTGNPLSIKVGDPTTPNASGVIVIEGDFWPYSNITYDTGAYSNLKNIPSVVWIIRGDLNIGPNVTELAGTFIVLGDTTRAVDCSPEFPLISSKPKDGCGQIVTCHGASALACSTTALTIRGNVMAKYFDLGRTFHDTSYGPSERFVNDGHLQANPPAGFEDLSNVIPRFTEN